MGKFKPLLKNQLYLLPPSIEDFIPEHHLARLVSEVVEAVDVSIIESQYSELGQNSYHPRILLKLLFYGYAIGIRSGRKIAAACESDTAFMYLSSMYRPDFRTINDFRKDNIDFIEKAFIRVIEICKGAGLGKVGKLVIDSTKIRANASPGKSKSKSEYEDWLQRTEKEIRGILEEAGQADKEEDELYGENRGDELPPELRDKQNLRKKIKEVLNQIEGKEKVNLTDNDARFIRGNESINVNYNCQTAMTEDGLVVVAYTTNNVTDRQDLIEVIERAEINTGEEFNEILADAGYSSYDNYETLFQRNKISYIPDQEKDAEKIVAAKNPYHRNHFRYDDLNDRFICPEGKHLPYSHFNNDITNKQKKRIYIGNECGTCAVRSSCTTASARQIHLECREELRKKVRSLLDSKTGKLTYRIRRRIEPIFGNIKHNLSYKMLQLRGLEKTTAEWALICLGHNLKLLNKVKFS
jgi:transposase